MDIFEIILPELGGSRLSAADLLKAHLPDDLRGAQVVLDCRAVQSLSQSYSDEICKQLLLLRRAESLVLLGPPSRMVKHVQTAVRLRELSGLEIRD